MTGIGVKAKIYEVLLTVEDISLQSNEFLISIAQSKYRNWSLIYEEGNSKSFSKNGKKLDNIIDVEIRICGLYIITKINEYTNKKTNAGLFTNKLGMNSSYWILSRKIYFWCYNSEGQCSKKHIIIGKYKSIENKYKYKN